MLLDGAALSIYCPFFARRSSSATEVLVKSLFIQVVRVFFPDARARTKFELLYVVSLFEKFGPYCHQLEPRRGPPTSVIHQCV